MTHYESRLIVLALHPEAIARANDQGGVEILIYGGKIATLNTYPCESEAWDMAAMNAVKQAFGCLSLAFRWLKYAHACIEYPCTFMVPGDWSDAGEPEGP
jgi:Mlc titration factor MtfA (ptsG expression regulator)